MFKDVIIFYSLFKIFVRPCLFFWMRRKRKKKEISKWTTNWEVRTVLGAQQVRSCFCVPSLDFDVGGKKGSVVTKRKERVLAFEVKVRRERQWRKGTGVRKDDGASVWTVITAILHREETVPCYLKLS